MHWLDLKVPPLLVCIGFAAAMFGVSRLTPGLSFALQAVSLPASALVALGAGLAISGVIAFRKKRTTVNPLAPDASSAVVSTGVYRVTRNPMYLGFFLMLSGWALSLLNLGAILLLPAFLAYMTQFQIKPEERALLARFGPEYEQYLAQVRRWI